MFKWANLFSRNNDEHDILSPNKRVRCRFAIKNGQIYYEVYRDDKLIVRSSRLGFLIYGEEALKNNLSIVRHMNKKYQIDTEENKKFLGEILEGLFRFGHKFPSPGGACYYLGDDGAPWADRPLETYQTCRMTHVYSMAGFLGHEGSNELVDAALKGLKGELRDKVNGGWYTAISPEGKGQENKLCYAHAFAMFNLRYR